MMSGNEFDKVCPETTDGTAAEASVNARGSEIVAELRSRASKQLAMAEKMVRDTVFIEPVKALVATGVRMASLDLLDWLDELSACDAEDTQEGRTPTS